jgi:hypothetical protein
MLIQMSWPTNKLVLHTGTWVGTQKTPQSTNTITLQNLVKVQHSAISRNASYNTKFHSSLQQHRHTTHGTLGVQTMVPLLGIIF